VLEGTLSCVLGELGQLVLFLVLAKNVRSFEIENRDGPLPAERLVAETTLLVEETQHTMLHHGDL